MANLSYFAIVLGILFAIALIGGLVALIVFLVGRKKGEGDPAPRDGSYFDGGYLAYFGYNFLIVFLTAITFGLAYPFMLCVYERWLARHTVICGKRMRFDGTGLQLIGNYILWSILSAITFGIYGFWMVLNLRKWKVKHTHFAGEEDDNSYFDGTVGGWLGIQILAFFVSLIPVVGLVWAGLMRTEWYAKHTVVDSRRLVFCGTLGQFFVKYLLWGLLTGITFGIFAFFVPVKSIRLETENMIDHEHTPEALLKQSEYRNSVQADAASFKSYRVEYEMEGMKAGITDVTSQEDLLNLANGKNRAAQYLYVIRYGEGKMAEEPFASLLAASAASEYAPAMALAAETLPLENEVKGAYYEKSAQGGVLSAIHRQLQTEASRGILEKNLELLKAAVRRADLLEKEGEALTPGEEAQIKQCHLAIRRMESAQLKPKGGKTALVVVAAVIGIPLILAILFGIVSLFMMRTSEVGRPAMGPGDAYSSDGVIQEYDGPENQNATPAFPI